MNTLIPLVVIGLVLDVLRSLGAEVDKQQESEEETGAQAHGPEVEKMGVEA